MRFQRFQTFVSTCAVTYCILTMLVLLLVDEGNGSGWGAVHGNESDYMALLSIKAHVSGDPMQVMRRWNHSLHFCQWKGVSCGRHHQRVTALNLTSLDLVGSISPSIGNLTFLTSLDLSNNSFGGEIPHEIGKLFRLQYLFLINNSLEGQIPSNLSHCNNLIELHLRSNQLVGSIPEELGSLSHLLWFSVSGNHLIGAIPSSLGNISSLQVLSLPGNRLKGSIPESLGKLKSLQTIILGVNELSGLVPPSIYNLSSLTEFWLEGNQLNGTLPQNLGLTLPNLQVFVVWGNQFSGSIPLSISNASNLESLFLNRNKFSSRVAVNFGNLNNLSSLEISHNRLGTGNANDLDFISTLTNCTKLTLLNMEFNDLGGALPYAVPNLSTHLQIFSVSTNKIFGSIPEGIGNLVNLSFLDLSANQLIGSIPTSFGRLYKLQGAYFHENKISGQIPFAIGNLTLLNKLRLNDNNFEGNIPLSLGNCHDLVLLNLSRNNLNGIIPREIIGLSSLSIYLDLSWNHLTGPLPQEVGNLRNLVELDLSHNMISGRIPSTLGSCVYLVNLHLDHNFIEGIIPQSLSSLRGLDELDLSQNKLFGEIPTYLGTFPFLRNLNLSFNDFEGEVPVNGAFKNASVISIYGNKKLCGGIPALRLSACSGHKSRKHKMLLFVVILATCALAITLVTIVLILCCLKKMRKKPTLWMESPRSFSYAKLWKATNGFSSTNLIGSGSYGSVYKGTVHPNEKAVAVKVLNLQNQEALKSFLAECKALRSIRHRNLIKIIDVCSSVDFQGNDFKALVYTFMENGSLETWLHPVPQEGFSNHEQMTTLNLLLRINIAIDVAVALDYLHNQCHTPIIHCDIKPSNILLDGDMTAYVGDFGIAKLLQENNELSHSQTSSIGIRGTIGYVAPEYGLNGDVSRSGDVYSYDILLLELFTGKRPTNDMFKEGLNLPKFVKMALPERVVEVVDQVLLSSVEEEMATNINYRGQVIKREKVQECLTLLLIIGVACTEESLGKRMKISDVARELHLVKEKLLGKRTIWNE